MGRDMERRILNLRRHKPKPKIPSTLGSLFVEEEEEYSRLAVENVKCGFSSEEERWKIQAEMLRAECKFLRMERDLALRKLEETQGRKKIDGSQRVADEVVKAATRRRRKGRLAHNFDRNASVIRRKMENIDEGDETNHGSEVVKEIREIAQSSDPKCRLSDVEILRMKMEGMSKGMMQRVEDFGRGTKNVRLKTQVQGSEFGAIWSGSCCKCKQVVQRIAEQVKAEKEQWTEMQDMLNQVKVEMEDLKSSRDLWQRQAIASELNLRTLRVDMLEWKRRAHSSEQKMIEVEEHMSKLKITLGDKVSACSSGARYSDIPNMVRLPKIKCQQQKPGQRSLDRTNKENEKHVLVCYLNKSKDKFSSRFPLQDVGNLSQL